LFGRASAFVAAVLIVSIGNAESQIAFPTKPVTLVVPYSAGASTDIVGRMLASSLSEKWKQPVVVANRVGASGSIGINSVIRSEPDGHTLVVFTGPTDLSTEYFSPTGTNTETDLTPVALVAKTPVVLMVRSGLNVGDFESFVRLARSKPGDLTFGSQGYGSLAHLAFEQVMSKTNIKMLLVPYKGAADISNAMIGGFLDAYIGSFTTARTMLEGGHARVLAVVGGGRIPAIPDVPTMAELGYPGTNWDAWIGIMAPSKTPPDIVEKISADIAGALSVEGMHQQISKIGLQNTTADRSQFQSLLVAERAKLAETIKAAGLTPQK